MIRALMKDAIRPASLSLSCHKGWKCVASCSIVRGWFVCAFDVWGLQDDSHNNDCLVSRNSKSWKVISLLYEFMVRKKRCVYQCQRGDALFSKKISKSSIQRIHSDQYLYTQCETHVNKNYKHLIHYCFWFMFFLIGNLNITFHILHIFNGTYIFLNPIDA